MASFFDTTIGQQVEFQRVLATAGFTSDDIALIIKKPLLASKMYASIQPTASVMGVTQPSWYVSPEQQLERVYQLNAERGWGFGIQDIPSVPEHFTPRTSTEMLMLAVYLPDKGKAKGLHRTFDELWDLIQAPDGYAKWRWDELKSDSKHLRQAPGYDYTPGIRWVAFDPNAFHGKSPEQALALARQDNVQLAGVEILMATLLFPTWTVSWNGGSSPYPNLSGLQFYWNADWSHVPCLGRWDGSRRLELSAYWAGSRSVFWASPVVREC